jgi:DnaJ-class molecular chaperone
MPQVHTHYDNLKVTRNAPPEVIRAAYKSLSQKFHPDRNPGRDATRTFQIIKSAYEVLSDPAKRREHDDWIALAESGGEQENVEAPRPQRAAAAAPANASASLKDMFREIPLVVQGIQQRYRTATHGSRSYGSRGFSSRSFAARSFSRFRRNPRHVLISVCWLAAATLIVFGILAT